ncbi:MAG TPA: ABC transporter ATP-binding protein [Afipia sp.]
MLQAKNLNAFYGKSQILSDVSLRIEAGETVGLLGRNGAGKTTLLRALAGLVEARSSAISLGGMNVQGWSTDRLSRAGLVLVPDYRGIIGVLTVEGNLLLAARRRSSFGLTDAYSLFPRLKERRNSSGTALSGGEQQMLAIARGLMCGPGVLLLDEPTEGLAPIILDEIVEALAKISRGSSKMAVLIVDQNVDVCLRVASRHYILELGKIVHEATSSEMALSPALQQRYLGVDA